MKDWKKVLKNFKVKAFIPFLLFVIFLGITSFFYENKVSYIDFVDEEENMVTGAYLLRREKMYRDIFSQHQPLPAIFSGVIQKVTNPNSIFLLIKRHREFMIVWTIIWATLLFFRFGVWTAGFTATFELTKIFLLGNLFLAESLVVYPLVYLTGLVLSKDGNKAPPFESFFIGLTISFLIFCLLPLWPVIALLAIIVLFKQKLLKGKKLIFLILGILPILVMVLLFISIPDYFKSVFIFNTKYYLPINQNQLSWESIPKSFFSFVMPFLTKEPLGQISLVIKLLSLALIGSWLYFLLAKKKKISLFLLTFIILGFANLRFIQPGLQYYLGFHLLPWYALLTFVVFWNLDYLTTLIKGKKGKVGLILVGLAIIMVSLFTAKSELFVKRDVDLDYYVNYSKQFDLGEAVRILTGPTDTLFVAPDQMLIYWQGKIVNASKYIYYYPFMDQNPIVQGDLSNMFENDLPTFVFMEKDLYTNLPEFLWGYGQITKDGKPTELYIRKIKMFEITQAQKDQLTFYNFALPKVFPN